VKKSKSVLKRIRQNEKHRMRNRADASKYKTEVKKFEAVIEKGDVAVARDMVPHITKVIDKAASKKTISKNAASRKKSSLMRRVNALG
jgi:small subunit ribosomal protein S20